ncbi:MAG: 50S ribosomal protein L33 [Chlamydiia bacterium]
MAASPREIIKLKSSESPTVITKIKNKRNTTGRIELKRYDKRLRKHVTFKESK